MITSLEQDIARRFGRRYGVLVGSGTSALYVIFKALNLPAGGRALYPDLTCETAVNAGLYAGVSPVFCDVNQHDFNLDVDQAARTCREKNVSVVVATHLFGHLMDINALKETLGQEVFVLEDAAQAYGGVLGEAQVGSMGDASVISFGAGKLLDCGGGGAVLTDDEKLYVRCQEVAKTLPADPVYRRAQYAACMKAMFLLHREKKEEVEFCRCRDELKRQYKDGYLSALAPASAATIGERLPELEKLSERRRVLAHELESVLKDELEIQLPIVQGGWVPWRYSFLVQGDRENWCKRFAAAGLAASRHFKPLHQEFPQPSETFPVATEISQKIINIDLLDAEQVRCGLKNIFIGEPCLIAR